MKKLNNKSFYTDSVANKELAKTEGYTFINNFTDRMILMRYLKI